MSLGLELYPPNASPDYRRRRLTFLAVWIGVAAMVTWPVYSFFGGIEPRILGLPMGLTWAVLAIVVIFVALLWLYLNEDDSELAEDAVDKASPAGKPGA